MAPPPDPDITVSNALQEGLTLALKAEDNGDWKPFVDWQVRNCGVAPELIAFLADQWGIRPLMTPLRVPATPTTVGGLELRELVGEGGMGVVHRAFDPVLKREVAVKLLRPGGALSADDRARFRFEAEAVAALDHPNVVPVLASGEADGLPYLVMPLMAGSLADWLKSLGPDRQLKPRPAAEIARDIARGIHHAHDRGIIHRDLKPGNILRDADGRWRVADFGLARMTDLTATRMAGTPAYMAPEQVGAGHTAPEQVRGGRRLTTAVDVHAVGVILFELLAGGPPFGGADVGSVLRRVADEPAPPVRTFRPDVPRDLSAIVAKCLEKRPEDRYPSAAALAEDLDHFIHGRPVMAGERGWMSDLVRAFGFSAPPQTLFTWRAFLVGGLSAGVCFGVMQAAVLLDAPRWVVWCGMGYYLLSWLAVLMWLHIFRRHHMKPVERLFGITHMGMWLGSVALTTIQLWSHGGDSLQTLPPLLVLIGVGTFTGGTSFWGRLYLEGAAIMTAGAVMAFLPAEFWPGFYGLILLVIQLWYSVLLYRHSRGADPPAA